MNPKEDSAAKKGHEAEKPTQIPAKGWKEVGLRVKDQITTDHIAIVSAGVAYYFFLALFPALIATISIYGLVMDPAEVQQQMNQLTQFLPDQAHQMLSGILEQMAGKAEDTLGWSMAASLLVSLWSAHQGTSAVFEGVNIAYNETEERGFFKRTGLTLLFTLGGIIAGIFCLALVVAFPALVQSINLPGIIETLIQWLRWPLMALLIIAGLGLIYKIAPDRDHPEFRWASGGAISATLLWLIGSVLFSLYINNFSSYDQTYGSFAAVIILMLWFYLTGFIILLGAEINSEMEHQTYEDSTIGEDQPMGQRDAYHADHAADENNSSQ